MEDTRVIVMGHDGVGKSALTVHFVNGIFVEKYDPTIEDSYRKNFKVDGKYFMLEVLDTSESIGTCKDPYIEKSDGYILVYSITDQSSFNYISELRDHIAQIKKTDMLPLLFVANKSDLEEKRVVTTLIGESIAQEYHAAYIETSAKTSKNVNEVFVTITRLIAAAHGKPLPKPSRGGCILT
uniref:Uncharacterized protein n=1 Tax=Arcella intermedia TaxID=1963864 RepID=A0A6B2LKL8_9EUKA|eukprot:TRINITY_DN8165_c0_g1_i1.p1 TRINITY_DN8165_c0_g1~~TRINITY_DN8165_c0_g1_i1.p1  ORF type:complete len:182 (-),score=50.78 TRINITY_DN8165_c0_g1_i1:36-581(-)